MAQSNWKGSRDFNAHLVRDTHAALGADRFAGSQLVDVPELGHELPPAELFERALETLLAAGKEPAD